MGKTSATVVREGLQAYADRGVFRSFAEQASKDEKIRFGFLYFGDKTMTLEFTEKDHTLVIRNMLASVSADMFRDLQAFLDGLSDPHLPAHRRIHKGSADVQFVKKGGSVSLVFQVKQNRYQYGVKKFVNLVSWVQVHLQSRHPEYLVNVMGEPEE
jgi:hypothetical protein